MVSPVRSVPFQEVEAAPSRLPSELLEPGRVLVCARCSHGITKEDARVSRAGSHLHTRMNPHGYVHEFGCFAEAPGCRLLSGATLEHTWFAGHAWRLAECASCGVHLGWRFEGESGTFFGLLLERLTSG